MSYPDAVDAFVRAAADAGIDISLIRPQGDAAQLCETVFGKALAADISTHGYPDRVGLPWIAEQLYVYGLDELSERQAGYRTDARDGFREQVAGVLDEADRDAACRFVLGEF